MTDDGERACDLLARERLRPHSSRVFTGARRWLWPEFAIPTPPIEMRCAVARSGCRASSGISGQRSCEVDTFVRAHRSRDIREAHPELVFLRLNAGRPLPSKKSEAGIDLRRKLLKREGIRDIDKWLTRERIGTGAKA